MRKHFLLLAACLSLAVSAANAQPQLIEEYRQQRDALVSANNHQSFSRDIVATWQKQWDAFILSQLATTQR